MRNRNSWVSSCWFHGACIWFAVSAGRSIGSELELPNPAVRGYRYLTEKAYLPPDFDEETFDELWRIWPDELKSEAEKASAKERKRMAFSRYGLSGRPEDPMTPIQYVVDREGNWTMSCFACHAGKLMGQTIPGLPNSHYALATLTHDIRKMKLIKGKPLSRMDVGSLVIPLGKTNGTTNAVMFGVALMAYRDAELNIDPDRSPPKMTHHDMDTPAWWHFKKKSHLYADGFAVKGHRALMQFMLVKENGPEQFADWESDYEDVYAYLSSLEPPSYPFEIDLDLASAGQLVFQENCARCHGTYGEKPTYPNRLVPLEGLGTDPVRLTALESSNRALYHTSWFGHFGTEDTRLEPQGYVAPPLDGVWASAPYFHNGSVPTLWHVLRPEQRPAVWTRSEDGYDRVRVGLEVREFEELPGHIRGAIELRTYFNTRQFGKSAAGHPYPDVLSESQKRAVLEYLKTL